MPINCMTCEKLMALCTCIQPFSQKEVKKVVDAEKQWARQILFLFSKNRITEEEAVNLIAGRIVRL